MRWLIVGLVLVALGSPAHAFHESMSFDRSANTGGGAGSYYTGSPRFKGYDCTLCHQEASGQIAIELGGNLTSGTYEPGLVYRIELSLFGEHRGLDSAFNPNTFTADITDDAGQPIGTFSAGPGSLVRVRDDGRVAVGEGFGEGENSWSFSWAAPVDAVPARLYVALLDGDGASDPDNRTIDPLRDDVATLRFDLCPSGMQCSAPSRPEPETSPAGCTAGPSRGGAWLLCGLLIAMFWRRARRGTACR